MVFNALKYIFISSENRAKSFVKKIRMNQNQEPQNKVSNFSYLSKLVLEKFLWIALLLTLFVVVRFITAVTIKGFVLKQRNIFGSVSSLTQLFSNWTILKCKIVTSSYIHTIARWVLSLESYQGFLLLLVRVFVRICFYLSIVSFHSCHTWNVVECLNRGHKKHSTILSQIQISGWVAGLQSAILIS